MSPENNLTEILAEELRAAAPYFGLKAELAGDLASAVVEKLRLRLGGDRLYMRRTDTGRRNLAIFKSFTGDNYEDLARQWNRSRRQIERIVDQERRRQQAARKRVLAAAPTPVAPEEA